MQALAAGGLDPGFQLETAQRIAHLESRFHDLGEAERGIRIQIDHEPVGVIGVVHRGAPPVQLDGVELHQLDEPDDVVDEQNLVSASAALEHMLAHAGHGVLLEEALVRAAVGTSHERERPVREIRHREVPYHLVVARKVQLGDARGLVHFTLGMRDAHSEYHGQFGRHRGPHVGNVFGRPAGLARNRRVDGNRFFA